MHIAKVSNRNARLSYLLRESYREDGEVKNRTFTNLSKLPVERIEILRAVLCGDPLAPIGDSGFEICRMATCLPRWPLPGASASKTCYPTGRRRDLALALIVARLLGPAGKLATARMLDSATASHSLHETTSLGSVTAREIYVTFGLARSRAGVHRKPARAAPSQERRARALRRDVHLSRETLLPTRTPRLQP